MKKHGAIPAGQGLRVTMQDRYVPELVSGTPCSKRVHYCPYQKINHWYPVLEEFDSPKEYTVIFVYTKDGGADGMGYERSRCYSEWQLEC